MRLINTKTFLLESFPSAKHAPPYAILSHTWEGDNDEVTFQEMTPEAQSSPISQKLGFRKIEETCRLAREEYHLQYAWVDTCCIDKSSSAELSEAINSMFKWYQQAEVCFAFLADWHPTDKSFGDCRWWKRGWTLQELVASRELVFHDKTWQVRGNKVSLCSEISLASNISERILRGLEELSSVPVAVRMSWASQRSTTREEDMAYSLLGIFDVNMPMLYGEGSKAFLRLQEEILNQTPDMSLFAWKSSWDLCQDYMGLLALLPREFAYVSKLSPIVLQLGLGPLLELSLSNQGVMTKLPLGVDDATGYYFLLRLVGQKYRYQQDSHHLWGLSPYDWREAARSRPSLFPRYLYYLGCPKRTLLHSNS